MVFKNVVFFFLLLTQIATAARDAPIANQNLEKVEEDSTSNSNSTNDCWGSLSEMRLCSNEIIGFFLNGQTDIDAPCCRAIEVIAEHCWPAMVAVLGVSAEQEKVLAGYCAKSPFVSSRD